MRDLPAFASQCLVPTPIDGTTNGNPVANAELGRFLDTDKRLANKYGATFIGLQTPVLAALERAEKLNHLAAMSLIPDQIHPQPPVHMLMTETILAGWNYPRLPQTSPDVRALTPRVKVCRPPESACPTHLH